MSIPEIKVGDRATLHGLEADLFVLGLVDESTDVSCWYWPPSCEADAGELIRVDIRTLRKHEEFCSFPELRTPGSCLTIRGTDDAPMFVLNAAAQDEFDPVANVEVIWKIDGILKKVCLPQCVFERYFESID